MIFHENRLPAGDSHEIPCLICYFCKGSKILNCHLLRNIGGALHVKTPTADRLVPLVHKALLPLRIQR